MTAASEMAAKTAPETKENFADLLDETLGDEGFEGKVGWDTGYVGELVDFARVCVDGVAPQATPQQAVTDLQLMLAIHLSAKTRRWEAVDEIDPALTMETLGLVPDTVASKRKRV